MNALLGVGQGSIRGSYLVTLEWKGLRSKKKPLAFVGKGVCFDTGGISLKPAKFMEDMTYDMAGSAVVVGLMKNLAIRKAKIKGLILSLRLARKLSQAAPYCELFVIRYFPIGNLKPLKF